jgi:surface polysaccharide O-acyltransferase-like enzyme
MIIFINGKKLKEEKYMDKNSVQKKRQTNLELLRIIAMLMVVTLHFMSHGGVLKNVGMFTKQYYFSWVTEGIAIVAVNLYVMISGYFLVESKFRLKKVIALICEVIFYSLIIYFLLLVAGMRPFSKKELLTAFIPTLTNVYGFFTVYICMYILSPFVNYTIKAMSKRQLLTCIIVELAFFSVWTNIIYFSPGLK